MIVKGKQVRDFQEFHGTEINFPVFDSDTDYTEGNCVTRTYVYTFKPPVDALDKAFTHIPHVLQSRPEYTIVHYWSADTQKALRERITRYAHNLRFAHTEYVPDFNKNCRPHQNHQLNRIDRSGDTYKVIGIAASIGYTVVERREKQATYKTTDNQGGNSSRTTTTQHGRPPQQPAARICSSAQETSTGTAAQVHYESDHYEQTPRDHQLQHYVLIRHGQALPRQDRGDQRRGRKAPRVRREPRPEIRGRISSHRRKRTRDTRSVSHGREEKRKRPAHKAQTRLQREARTARQKRAPPKRARHGGQDSRRQSLETTCTSTGKTSDCRRQQEKKDGEKGGVSESHSQPV